MRVCVIYHEISDNYYLVSTVMDIICRGGSNIVAATLAGGSLGSIGDSIVSNIVVTVGYSAVAVVNGGIS